MHCCVLREKVERSSTTSGAPKGQLLLNYVLVFSEHVVQHLADIDAGKVSLVGTP